jgi:hypothetical protein
MLWQGWKHNPATTPRETLIPRGLRVALIAAGGIALALGLVLVLKPSTIDQYWPWRLTPLMSQVIGGWLLFIATGALCMLVEVRYVAYRVYLPVAATWFAILLIASLLNHDDFDSDRLATPLYFIALAVTVVALAAISLYLEATQRAREVTHTTMLPESRHAEGRAE